MFSQWGLQKDADVYSPCINTCSMYTQNKAALFVQKDTDTMVYISKNKF